MKLLRVLGGEDLAQAEINGVGTDIVVASNTVSIPAPPRLIHMHRISVPAGSPAVRAVSTIEGAEPGTLVVLAKHPASPGNPIIIDGTGNLQTDGNYLMDGAFHTITFACVGSQYVELARAPN